MSKDGSAKFYQNNKRLQKKTYERYQRLSSKEKEKKGHYFCERCSLYACFWQFLLFHT